MYCTMFPAAGALSRARESQTPRHSARRSGGDGGNRTRVRKSGRSDFYERSRLVPSPSERPQPTKGLAPRWPLLLGRGPRQTRGCTPTFCRPHRLRSGDGAGGRAPAIGGAYPARTALGSHGQGRDRSAHGTSCACAGFTRSRTSTRRPAPFLSRRTLASPCPSLLYRARQGPRLLRSII